MLADALIATIAGMLNAAIVAAVCSPIAFLCSIGIKREYSIDFWFRTIVLSQILFWGSLILDMSATSYGYFKDAGDVIKVALNFIISVPATALLIRTCMRYRKSKSTTPLEEEDPSDRLNATFNTLKKAKSVASKVEKAIPKQ